MFTCKACLSRALHVIIDHASSLPQAASLSTLRPTLAVTASPQLRQYTTAAAAATTASDAPEGAAETRPSPSRSPPRGAAPRGRSSPTRQAEWAARKELEFLTDPFHIAHQVQRTLAKGDFEAAALLTRKAGRNANVTVSWNHLIDHVIRADKIHAALQLYNEMKKRAQLPNAQTYTIIFRGCARSSHGKLAVSEAVKLYNNMIARERVKPNTLHMNAVLQVCAKAGDIESLFTIVQTANDGLRAANNLTYTTIFNALRAQASEPVEGGLEDAEVRNAKAKVIQQAKTIWEEVISRWRSGAIVIDEELVCAMGRILLLGEYREAEEVETLIEQTMNFDPPGDDNKAAIDDTKHTHGDKQSNRSTEVIARGPRWIAKTPNGTEISHALPGNNSLSMILMALRTTRKTTRSLRYWGIFTKRYNVIPDRENWTQLLTTFSIGKNSTRAVAYLEQMPSNIIETKHIRIAMGTCLRDNINSSAFKNATRVLEIMLTNVTVPDVLVMRKYIQVAYANKRLFEEQSKNDFKGAMAAWGKQLTVCLDNLWKPYMAAAKQLSFSPVGAKQDVIALARKMISGYDRLVQEKMVPPDVEKRIKKARNNLNRFVVSYFEDKYLRDHLSKNKYEDVADEEAEEEEGIKEELDFDGRSNHGRNRNDVVRIQMLS